MSALELQLCDCVESCAAHLEQLAPALRDRNQTTAAECAESIACLSRIALASAPADRFRQVMVVAELHAQTGGNGLGDAVIWPALRRAGEHRLCEEWTRLTNELRATRVAYRDAADVLMRPSPAPTPPADIEYRIPTEIAILVRNASGELEFFKTCVSSNEEDRDEGRHFELAELDAEEAGYEAIECLDPYDPAGRALGLRTGAEVEAEYSEVIASRVALRSSGNSPRSAS